ncbi:MAG: hypothetical protein ACE5E1_10805, partial [Phycisphaerae bacterium]
RLRMDAEQAKKLASILPSRFYRSREAMVEAARTHSMANLIDTDTGLKIDLSVLPTEPFYKAVMSRRRKVEYKPGGPGFWAVSPEYIVLMKLLRRQVTRSEKQWENALAVVRVQGAALDWAYLRRWADELHIAADMRALHTAAGI